MKLSEKLRELADELSVDIHDGDFDKLYALADEAKQLEKDYKEDVSVLNLEVGFLFDMVSRHWNIHFTPKDKSPSKPLSP